MADPVHAGKKTALIYPALLCWADGAMDNIFLESKLATDRQEPPCRI